MKKKIFINIHYLEIGGAERALIGLLQALDYNKVEVDLFVNQHTGPLMAHIPPQVNLLPESRRWSLLEKSIVQALRKGCIDIAAARLFGKTRYEHYRRKTPLANGLEDIAIYHYITNTVLPLLPRPAGKNIYDIALSFLMPHHQVAYKVNAHKKIAWIHTDYSRVVVNTKAELPIWSEFDYIASISPDVTRTFTSAFPTLGNKIIEIENIISPEFVRAQAELGTAPELENKTHIKLLSVGRPCYAKNFECIPPIVKDLRQRGLDVHWYVVGGLASDEIRTLINETETGDYVHFVGSRTNPYPYIAACDIYVQPSRYEGKSITVREAQILCKPVVATAYPTAPSQIRDRVDGIIVPLEPVACAEALYKIIIDTSLQSSLINHLRESDYGNMTEVEKIYNLLNA